MNQVAPVPGAAGLGIPAGAANPFGLVGGAVERGAPRVAKPDEFVTSATNNLITEGLDPLTQTFASSGGLGANPALLKRFEEIANSVTIGEKLQTALTRLFKFQRDQALERIQIASS